MLRLAFPSMVALAKGRPGLRFVASAAVGLGALSIVACSSESSLATSSHDPAGVDAGADDAAPSASQESDGGPSGGDDATNGARSCAGVTCSTPPATVCLSATTSRTYVATGTCLAGACTYAYTDATCAHGCQGNACVGADPCNGVSCNAPPPSSCVDAGTLKKYSGSGTCSGGTCSYTAGNTACACASGACVSYGPAAAVSVSYAQACALTTGGAVKCWGANSNGALGNNTTSSSRVPVDVSGLSTGATAIAVGTEYACALTNTGGAKCWGYNAWGQLGNNTKTSSHVPVDVVGLSSGVSKIAVSSYSTCALMSSGGVKCWGAGDDGQLGNDSTSSSLVPIDVPGLSGVTDIALGHRFACAVTSSGGVKCWGWGAYGQVGAPLRSLVPVDVGGLGSGVTAISANNWSACALTNAGGIKCWGSNQYGQLGDGSTQVRAAIDVAGLSTGVSSVSEGGAFTCARTNGGTVKCLGANDVGQLGDNHAIGSTVPVDVFGLSSVARLSAGFGSTCAVTTSGGIRCWGYNSNGQLGNNTILDSRTPVAVVGFP
jgi:hypothetical protein